jgi:hypothetical protein
MKNNNKRLKKKQRTFNVVIFLQVEKFSKWPLENG